jgi:hypothetical protein
MNIPESRDFVVKYRPICCGKQVDISVQEHTNSWQNFICRTCDKSIRIQYWPLREDDIRELKLNSILNESR